MCAECNGASFMNHKWSYDHYFYVVGRIHSFFRKIRILKLYVSEQILPLISNLYMLQPYYQHYNIINNMKPKIYIFQRTKKQKIETYIIIFPTFCLLLENEVLLQMVYFLIFGYIIAQPLSHAYVREVCRLRDQEEAVESLVSLHPSERFTDTSITQKRVGFTE